ncbi:MAG: hypothetical protein DWI22_07165 [Planctomycetota bacterium]|nr:MAG: hypothetical protein DWI22_07165 [Planctomycetota bacterium]
MHSPLRSCSIGVLESADPPAAPHNPDGNDAQLLRNDPLFKSIVGKDPRCEDEPLASGSTINRFLHAFTRREAEKPIDNV